MEALRSTLDILPVATVPVELLDAIWDVSEALAMLAQSRWLNSSADILP
jgi:hypothetical protein